MHEIGTHMIEIQIVENTTIIYSNDDDDNIMKV